MSVIISMVAVMAGPPFDLHTRPKQPRYPPKPVKLAIGLFTDPIVPSCVPFRHILRIDQKQTVSNCFGKRRIRESRRKFKRKKLAALFCFSFRFDNYSSSLIESKIFDRRCLRRSNNGSQLWILIKSP